MYPFREPKLGEMLYCGMCGNIVHPVDEEWMAYFNRKTLEERMNVFNTSEDYFMSYDGCDEDNFNRFHYL